MQLNKLHCGLTAIGTNDFSLVILKKSILALVNIDLGKRFHSALPKRRLQQLTATNEGADEYLNNKQGRRFNYRLLCW